LLRWPKIKQEAIIKYGIGIGIAFSCIDHHPINLFGLILLMIFATLYLKDMDYRAISWGSKWVTIPMFAMLGVTLIRLAIYHNVNEASAVIFFVIAIILYLISRKMGKGIIKVLLPFAIVEIVCIVIMAIINHGEITSGFIGQYNRAAGFLAYIALLYRGKYQWLLVVLSGLAIILTGALEGLIIIAALGIMILIKRDWCKKLWIPLMVLAIILLPLVFNGEIQALYSSGVQHLYLGDDLPYVLNGRAIVYKEALQRLSILGHGYTNNYFDANTVHNVPLIVFDQLGVFAGIAWIVATGYCLIKTKAKYLWGMILVMGLFDHFVWTGLAPLWWLAVGVSTTSQENDNIFKLRG